MDRRRKWIALLLVLLTALGQLPHPALASVLPEEGSEEEIVLLQTEPEEAEEEAIAGEDGLSAPEEVPAAVPETGERHTVTGFVKSGPVVELTLNKERRPGLSSVLAQLPDTVSVYLDGGHSATEVPVSWFCVGDEYESSEAYYFQFSPKWNEERYALAEGLEVIQDAPYAAVFMTDSEISPLGVESVEAEAFQYLVGAMGLNKAAACGVLANICHESSFKPNNLQNSYEKKLGYTDETYTAAVDKKKYKNFVKDSAGYGLCQWTYWTLKRDLLAYVQKQNKSIGDAQAQMEFLKQDLGATRTKELKAMANSAAGAYKAAEYFCKQYERPANTSSQAVARGNLAKNTYWPKYKGVVVNANPGADTTLDAPKPVSATNTAQGVQFTWSAVSGAKKYRVYRREGSGSWTKLADVSALSYMDKSPHSGTAYTYTVRCLNAAGAEVSKYDANGVGVVYYEAPVLTEIKNVAKGIRVKWKAVDAAAHYLVYRKEYGGKWGKLAYTDKSSYVDTGAKAGKSYYYAVRCADQEENPLGWYHISDLLKRLGTPTPKVVNAAGGVTVSWKGVTGAGEYYIYRKTGSGKWAKIKELKGAKKSSFTDSAVKKKNGVTYTYTVRAVSGSSGSDCDQESGKICRLTAPGLSGVQNTAAKKAAVKWKKNAKAQGYQIRYVLGSAKKTVNVKGAGTVSHTLTGLAKGKTYTVSVRAYRKDGEKVYYSAWSGTKKVAVKK